MSAEQESLFEGTELDREWKSALAPVVYKCEDCGKPISAREARVSGLGTACAAKRGRQAYREVREAPGG